VRSGGEPVEGKAAFTSFSKIVFVVAGLALLNLSSKLPYRINDHYRQG